MDGFLWLCRQWGRIGGAVEVAACDGAIDAEGLGGAAVPAERSGASHHSAPQLLLVVIVRQHLVQCCAPAFRIEWLDEASASAGYFGHGRSGGGEDSAAAG